MKDITKFILKILLLGLLVIPVILVMDPGFREKEYESMLYTDYRRSVGDIEVAIFGSSHAYCSYDPRIFEVNGLGNTFNFGGSGQIYATMMPVIDQVLKENTLKVAIVDIFNMSIRAKISSEHTMGLQLRTLDNLDYSIPRFKAYTAIFGYKNLQNISPTIRNHVEWNNLLDYQGFMLTNESEYYKGYFSERMTFTNATFKKFMNKIKPDNTKEAKDELEDVQKRIIDRVIAKFRSKNIPVIFVSAPTFFYRYDPRYKRYQDLIKKYLDERGVAYLDYNRLWDKIHLRRADFRDPNHLNPKGALKVSQHLSSFIADRFKWKSSDPEKFPANRYYQIQSNFKDAILKYTNRDETIEKITGVKGVYLYETSMDKFEIIFEQNPKAPKPLHLRFEYELRASERDSLIYISDKFEKRIRRDKIVYHDLLKAGQRLNYRGKNYLVFQFVHPFERFSNLNLSIGPNRDLLIFKNENIKL